MNRYRSNMIAVLTLALLLAGSFVFAQDRLGAGPVRAQGSTPTDDQVNAIAKQLYCPVCENTPLDVCPTEACRQWRELIRTQLGQGWTEDQIKQYFVANYGARVLDEPPRQGLNWLVYILPPVLILAGAFVLLRAMRGWTRASTAAAGAGKEEETKPDQDEYIARLEEELHKKK